MSEKKEEEIVVEDNDINKDDGEVVVLEDQESTEFPEGDLEDVSNVDAPQETNDDNKDEEKKSDDKKESSETAPDASENTNADDLLKDDADDESLLKDTEDTVNKRMEGISEAEQNAEQEAARVEADERSVFVKNVHFNTKDEELKAFFQEHTSGKVNRVTLVHDKFTHAPTGNAYVEFESRASVEAAIAMNGFEFKGRKIEVKSKRTNIHNFGGRGGRRDRGRGAFNMPYGYPPYMPYPYPPYPYPTYRGRGGYRGH